MKNKIVPIVTLASTFIVSLIAYPRMPDRVATHWDASGQVDGYMSRGWGIFFVPILMIGLYALLYYVPMIDPRKSNIEKFRKYYDQFLNILLIFLLVLHLFTISWNLGYRVDITIIMAVALAAFFYAMGQLVGAAKPNYFIGIRTPWTLASDSVWEKTHRLGAKLYKAAAVISLLGLLFRDHTFWFTFLSIIIASFYLVVFSYIAYRKEIK